MFTAKNERGSVDSTIAESQEVEINSGKSIQVKRNVLITGVAVDASIVI